MLKKITLLAVLVLFSFQAFGQSHFNPNLKIKIKNIDGTEMSVSNNVVAPKTTSDHYFPVTSPLGDYTFTFHPTGVFSGYDLESNGSTQQIWVDPNHPDSVHTVYMNSAQTSGWSDRNSAYIASNDGGLTWTNYGAVPVGTRTGFPSISGLPDGRAVIANHSNHGKVYVDESALAGNFTVYDPGADSGSVIWPRVLGVSDTKIAFAGSVNGGTSWVNTLDLPGGTFTGFVHLTNSASAETYHLAKNADGSVVGLAYLGEGDDAGDVFYQESNDGGVTWTAPLKIWDLDTNATGGTLGMVNYGPIRGIEMTYLNNDPCVVFEIGKQDIAASSFYPGVKSFIGFWNPAVSNTPKIIADSLNVTEFPSLGTNDVMFPICRPVIGHSADNEMLFVAFHGASSRTMGTPDVDETSFFDGYFLSSSDAGATWTAPQKFTPDQPVRDWRYPSMAPIIPIVGNAYRVQMTIQSDSIAGSTVNAPAGYPVGVTAEFVGVQTEIPVTVGVNDPKVNPFTFNLSQNYPNPFNPSTKIKYSVAERSNVTLKVFDVLGREVATLVNETKGAGSYTANFDASKLSSGLYIYKLTAGSNTLSKKMMLVK